MRERRALPTRSHFRRAANVRFRVGALFAVLWWGLVTFPRPSRVRGGGAVLAAPKAASKLPELQDASRPPFRSLGRGRGGPRPRGGGGAGVLRIGWGRRRSPSPGGRATLRPYSSHTSFWGAIFLLSNRGWVPPLVDSLIKDVAPERARGSGIQITVAGISEPLSICQNFASVS